MVVQAGRRRASSASSSWRTGSRAHGELRLDAYAERFCAAGIGAFVFDYRFFGASGGRPRQVVDIPAQLDDWRQAVSFARGIPWADPARVALFGTSFSGGHVVFIGAEDPKNRGDRGAMPVPERPGHLRGSSARLPQCSSAGTDLWTRQQRSWACHLITYRRSLPRDTSG